MNDDLIQLFSEEAYEIIDRLRDQLAGLEAASDHSERLTTILRGLHTLKGGAATCGLIELKNLAHELESYLLAFKGRSQELTAEHTRYVLTAIDHSEALIQLAGSKDQAGIASLSPDAKASSSSAKAIPGLVLFDELAAEQPSPLLSPNSEALPPEGKGANVSAKQETLRVPLERIERNFDVISEIFLTRNQMRYLVEKKIAGQLNEGEFIHQWEILDNALRKCIGELEQLAMAMRMMPIKSLFRRMETTVRSYTVEMGKKIVVEISGEETELDKKILDSLAEPLIHLTRNAMDHGVESLEERQQLGKKEIATIRLAASVSGNDVILTISDDGRGMDPDHILAAARKRGLIGQENLSRDEALKLIFAPGFSTKDTVSDVSGRGIGMEAVKNYVESIGGSIAIDTAVHVGTTFTLNLPLGMSVIPAILAKANGQAFAVIASDILETRKTSLADIHQQGEKSFFNYHGNFIPCYNISRYLYSHTQQEDAQVLQAKAQLSLCLIAYEREIIALVFEELSTHIEIVTKRLPPLAAEFAYVAGVTILATGEPTFVISLKQLYQTIRGKTSPSPQERAYAAA